MVNLNQMIILEEKEESKGEATHHAKRWPW